MCHVRIPTACSELQRERKESVMTYSIIGSGAIGSALAGHFASKGIEVSLANNRGPASLKEIVRKLGSKVKAVTVKEAACADIVILAVPFPAVPDAVSAVSDWRGRIVVDATNAVDLPSFTPTDLGGSPARSWPRRFPVRAS